MSFVRTFLNYRPSQRFDDNSWMGVKVFESSVAGVPWLEIDDQAFAIPDLDPEVPGLRNVTTDDALIEEGWYRLGFYDALGNLEYTDPVHAVGASLPPSPNDVRAESPLLRQLYPLSPYDPEKEEELQLYVNTAVQLIQSMLCGRMLDVTLPTELILVARRAVALKVETMAMYGSAEQRQAVLASGNLRSFTAGPYSESYFGPNEAIVQKVVDPDPATNEAIWALMTDECRQAWRALWGDAFTPGAAVMEFDWMRPTGRIG